ncbi:MAG: hypothetical protein NVS1B4_25310 [Gemmatimonadaceae bacterium]
MFVDFVAHGRSWRAWPEVRLAGGISSVGFCFATHDEPVRFLALTDLEVEAIGSIAELSPTELVMLLDRAREGGEGGSAEQSHAQSRG